MTREAKIAELTNIRDHFNYTLAPREVFDDAIKALEQEPKTGHWEWLRCDMYVCSECKNVYTDLSGIKDGMNYCPNCGSRNEVEE